MNKIELLAPAGTKDAFLAAISAGANAIYFGLQDFNARQRAKNIQNDELAKLIKIAHKHNVRAYLTLNVLVYSSEFENARKLVDFAVNCGIDAVIVQDLGMIQFLRENFPNLELHASTQLTTHNLEQCKFLADLGVKQVNLCRELSLQEIKPLCEYLNSRNVATEVFVHGAFCVSYSGQCYFSGGLYELKGNRGECVQPCRRTYKSNGKTCTPFNLKDNCLFQNIDELYKIGVKSLKIEGRIKSPEYVWAVTSAYREQIDKVYANVPLEQSDFRLTSSMNRMFTNQYLLGNVSKSMFTYGQKDHSLEFVGLVDSFYADKKSLTLSKSEFETNTKYELLPNDEITILEKNGDFVCTGKIIENCGIVNGKQQFFMQITGKLAKHIQKGCQVYKIPSVITETELKKLAEKLENIDEPICVVAKGCEDLSLELDFSCCNNTVTVKSSNLLSKSENAGLTHDLLAEKLGRLGNTGFYLKDLNTELLDKGLFLPLSELNALKRSAVELLKAKMNGKIEQRREAGVPNSDVDCRASLAMTTNCDVDCRDSRAFNDDVFFANSKTTEKVFVFNDLTKVSDFLVNCEQKENLPIVFELPLNPSLEHLQVFKRFPFIIPLFQAILFEPDFKIACELLLSLKPILTHNFVMVENLGFAKFAFNNGFCIIPGFQVNTFNNKTVQFFSENFGAKAVVVSSELSDTELKDLQSPVGTEIWLCDENAKLLMQSRQCLLCNIPSAVHKTKTLLCTKEAADRTCLQNCDKTINLVGMQAENVIAVKKPGFYSRLYKLNEMDLSKVAACKTEHNFPSEQITRKIVYVL